jgi:predicted Zn-dependent protease
MTHPLHEADSLRRAGRPEEALGLIGRVLERTPGRLGAMIIEARCLLDLERVTEALERLDEIVGRDPLHLVARELQVETAVRAQDAVRARTYLNVFGELVGRSPSVVRLEQSVEALESSSKAPGVPEEASNDSFATTTLANLYLEQGHRSEAQAMFERVLAANPGDVEARKGLARLGSGTEPGGPPDRPGRASNAV